MDLQPPSPPAPPPPDGEPRLVTFVLVLCACAALHLLWCGLTATRTLLNFAPFRDPRLPGFDRASLLVHVQASWIALAVTLNAGWLLWRRFGLAGPLNMVAGAVTLYLYFEAMQWRSWIGLATGWLGMLVVLVLGITQIGAPLSPSWPRGAGRRVGVVDLVVILVLTAVPLVAGSMVAHSAEAEMVRTLEEDPQAILAVLDADEALQRAESLAVRRPDITRAIAEELASAPVRRVRTQAWRLLGLDTIGTPTARLVAGLKGEREAQVRLAILEALGRREDAEAVAAVEHEVRGAAEKSLEHLVRVVQRLSEADPRRHVEARRAGSQRLTAARLAGGVSDGDFRAALARAGPAELDGLVAAIEAAPAGALPPDGEAEHAVRAIWNSAARREVETARSGLPEGRPLPRRLAALVLGDVATVVGGAPLQGRWRAIAPSLRDADPRVREAAAYALFRLQGPAVANDLTLALADTEPLVRLFAAMAHAEMHGTAPGGTFEEIYADPRSPWRLDAALYLLRYSHDRSVLPFLFEQVGGEAGPRVRETLKEVLGEDLGAEPRAWRERFR